MIENKVVVVTGGAGLLGKNICSAIAKNGGIPIIADIDLERSSILSSEINGVDKYKSMAVVLDMTSESSIINVIDEVKSKYSKINAVINSAYPRNSNYGRKLKDVTYLDFCENVTSHLGGYFLVSQKFAEYFCSVGEGSIINISSIYGSIAPRFDLYSGTAMTVPIEYVAVKSAIIQLSKYFSQYYKEYGIRVNTVSPGGILQNQPEEFLLRYNARCGVKGMLSPEDIVGTVLFLLSDLSSYINGQNIVVDDGFSL